MEEEKEKQSVLLIVKFKDEQIQKSFDCMMSLQVEGWFRRSNGEESPQVQEIIEHLLSPELRPALRSWYSLHGNQMNPAATDFRERLSKLPGEKFG